MQKLPDFVPAFSHHLKPLMRDGSQFTCMLFHPRIDGGIALDCPVESQQLLIFLLSKYVVSWHLYLDFTSPKSLIWNRRSCLCIGFDREAASLTMTLGMSPLLVWTDDAADVAGGWSSGLQGSIRIQHVQIL